MEQFNDRMSSHGVFTYNLPEELKGTAGYDIVDDAGYGEVTI